MTPLVLVFQAIDVEGLVDNLVGQEYTNEKVNFIFPHSITEKEDDIANVKFLGLFFITSVNDDNLKPHLDEFVGFIKHRFQADLDYRCFAFG